MNPRKRQHSARNKSFRLLQQDRVLVHDKPNFYHENKRNDDKNCREYDHKRIVGGVCGWLSRYVEHEKKMLVCE